ncbi:integrase catalytic domain-containing protein [Nephila pilipes]|uniref:Integrase catalytic domain-containing protein n=1 Tax=Nephila pilipes TaxID=299642 RepID=A0A8X6TQA1_NEPPI|nr:integrase catalytic domain-containing protein [Nephila pilipes]
MWKPFVANRMAPIQALTLPECWGHCSGSDNPVDLTTREESARKILSCSLWWLGLAWLSRPVHTWAFRDLQYSLHGICDTDMVVRKQRTTRVNPMMANSGCEISHLFRFWTLINFGN